MELDDEREPVSYEAPKQIHDRLTQHVLAAKHTYGWTVTGEVVFDGPPSEHNALIRINQIFTTAMTAGKGN